MSAVDVDTTGGPSSDCHLPLGVCWGGERGFAAETTTTQIARRTGL